MVICFCHVSNINVNIQYSTSRSIITIFTIHSNTMSKKKEKSGDFESESGDREICSNLLKIPNSGFHFVRLRVATQIRA